MPSMRRVGCSPGDLAYAAIEAAYTHGDRWVDEQIRYLRENAVLVKELVAEHMPGVLLYGP